MNETMNENELKCLMNVHERSRTFAKNPYERPK